ncbi:MAG: hypothetical protein LBQ37_02555 [Elusimicrobiota bacterium]|jgi:hypothetical protein|nr:hypothetical protein [Elusimicrobiota bacterium]
MNERDIISNVEVLDKKIKRKRRELIVFRSLRGKRDLQNWTQEQKEYFMDCFESEMLENIELMEVIKDMHKQIYDLIKGEK